MTQQIQPTCLNCNHNTTCLLTKALSQVIQQHFKPDTTPVQTTQLAEICTAYQSTTVIQTLLDNLQQNGEQ